MKLHGDFIEEHCFQTNVTVLKVEVKVRVWNFGGQLEHRWSSSLISIVFCIVGICLDYDLREDVEIDCVVEVMHGERYETLALSSRSSLTIGFSWISLNFSCSSHSTASPSVIISLRLFVWLVLTRCTVESDAGMKLNRDLIEEHCFQTNVTVLKVEVKVRVWKFGGQLEHRWSSSLEFIVFSTVDVCIECDWREGVEINCVAEVLHGERFETLPLRLR